MKHNFLKKLIATSVITSSIFSICPTTVLAAGVNYAGVGQTNGQWSKQGENWYYYVGGQLQKGWIYDRTGWYYADMGKYIQQDQMEYFMEMIYRCQQNHLIGMEQMIISHTLHK